MDKKLVMNIKDSRASSRIKFLYVPYRSFLRGHGLSTVVRVEEKIAVTHVSSATRLESFCQRLKSDLVILLQNPQKAIKAFMALANKLIEVI